jgi:hypothetical protein
MYSVIFFKKMSRNLLNKSTKSLSLLRLLKIQGRGHSAIVKLCWMVDDEVDLVILTSD